MDFLWIWLLVGDRVLSALTPFTSKFGATINLLSMIAEIAFCIICFFYASAWWYGLIALAVYFFMPVFVPKLNPDNLSDRYIAISGTLSFLHPVLVVLMYLSLFNVI